MTYLRLYKICIMFLILPLFLSGCARARIPGRKCTVLFEDNPALYFPGQIYEVCPMEDLSVSVGVPHGERISSVNYEDYSLSAKTGESLSYDYYTLTLHQIRYSAVLRLTTAPSYSTAYHAGEGRGESIFIQENSPHLRFNTLPYREQFTREGFLPVGWNTEPDGSGTHTGFGSRIDHRGLQHLELYMEWLPCTGTEFFSYELKGGQAAITGYHGTGDVVIPALIDGCPVTSIAEHAFGDVSAERMALPPSLKTVEANAFGNVSVRDFYFFDNIEKLPEEAFESYRINRLHINAVLDPAYSGSYFDTFADKADYLWEQREHDKIVLFCGSSARFGYDSPKLEAAFPGYQVVNMGVFAYANMLPQAHIVLSFIKEGDILLSSPELDAIDKQFCGETALDKETFCMLESNYDLLTLADCGAFTEIFSAFQQYNDSRRDMAPRSYLESPSCYDEDGRPQSAPAYNRWGDYVLYRENNAERKLFGIKRAYYHPKYIRQKDMDGLNAVYDAFREQGAEVFFAYSPRSEISISKDSAPEAIQALDEMLRSQLHARIISSVHVSLMDPLYFYGTDNHLSTEGAALHTEQIIKDLRAALEDQP